MNQPVSYERAKRACFLTCGSTAITANLPPLLFLTFREQFGISFSQIGLLVLVNFGVQLLFDALFSFFSHKFNIPKTLRFMPALMVAGMALYSLLPLCFPEYGYLGLLLGTAVFAVGNGLAEVLVSPTVASIPSPNPDRTMSRLHSCYAWGVPAMVVVSTLFFRLFGTGYWYVLTLLLAVFPLCASLMLFASPIPPVETPKETSEAATVFRNPTVLFYVACIFLGGATECTMSQWCSGYLETAFGIEKSVGDLLGMALFGLMMSIARTLYARIGRNIGKVLFYSALGAVVCYFAAVVSENPVVGLLGCACTGFFSAMLWPGSLIAVAEKVPHGGVALYALMALGGDLGASLCPQGVGLVTDAVIGSGFAPSLSEQFGITVEQLGIKAGMAFAMLFPIALTVLYGIAQKKKVK